MLVIAYYIRKHDLLGKKYKRMKYPRNTKWNRNSKTSPDAYLRRLIDSVSNVCFMFHVMYRYINKKNMSAKLGQFKYFSSFNFQSKYIKNEKHQSFNSRASVLIEKAFCFNLKSTISLLLFQLSFIHTVNFHLWKVFFSLSRLKPPIHPLLSPNTSIPSSLSLSAEICRWEEKRELFRSLWKLNMAFRSVRDVVQILKFLSGFKQTQ